MCKKIIEATIRDMEEKTDMIAYPAVYREEQRDEDGPIDAPDEHEQDEHGIVGTELTEAEEQEQELLDGFVLPGTQDDEQTRKIDWMRVPRRVRRAVRRLHHML
eukprot:863032-Lingulodinium_polyedra.AAC.1